MYKIIDTLCKNEGITVSQMCNELSITKSCLSELSSGRTKTLSYKNQKKIADYFGVSTDYLNQYDLKEKAIEKFGFCWSYEEREEKKANSRGLIEKGNLNDDEIIKNAEIIFRALFSRSLENALYNSNHVDFPTYTAMLLNQPSWKKICDDYGDGIYDKLVRKYGKKDGISQGSYYEIGSLSNSNIDASHSNLDEQVKLIARKTKDLPESDREELLNLLNNTVDVFLKAKKG